MESGLPGWGGAVGSCLAIQAAILLAGSLLGLNHQLGARDDLPLKAAALPFDRSAPMESARTQLKPDRSLPAQYLGSMIVR